MTATTKEEPWFEHDCSVCVFIGSTIVHGQAADVYLCPQGGLPTGIVRWSSQPADYSSAPLSTWSANTRSTLAHLIGAEVAGR